MNTWKYLLIPAVVLFFGACGISQSEKEGGVLPATAFNEQINATPDGVVLDVRTPAEFSEGHLDHAKNVNWTGNTFDSEVAQLDKSKPYFVYCLAGSRSAAAAQHMRDLGFKTIYELDGGILKWRAHNLPETGADVSAGGGMTESEFKQLLNDDRTVLVDFYAEWCGPCKKMKPSLDEIAAEMSATVKVVRIDVDKNPDLAKSLKVDALPTIMIVRNNSVIWNNVGLIEKAELVSHLKN